jgi:hypothetical protein
LEVDPSVDYGTTPTYDIKDESGNIKYPSKEDTAEWGYEFSGWTDGNTQYGKDNIPPM